MAGNLHDMRELGPQERSEPSEAWIEHPDGSRTDTHLLRTGRLSWTATPAEPVRLMPGMHLRVDRLGPQQTVAFMDVLPPEAPAGHE